MKKPILCETVKCTGCAACKNICKEGCITLLQDAQGFLQPRIDHVNCNQCGMCERSCPVLNSLKIKRVDTPIAYACWHIDEHVRMHSSSGGAFSSFAEAVLHNGGIVYGAAYDEGLWVRHIGVEEIDELPKLRGSKYVQSEIGDAFKKIKHQLKEGREVFFVGTPCQVAGLFGFLGKDYENLITADLVCHGVPSPLVFQKYISNLKEHYKADLRGINFRDKRHGWENNSVVAISDVNVEYHLKGQANSFFNGFILNTFLRESCYECNFNGLPRTGDITFADFWGIQKSSLITQQEIDKGISLLMLNNPLKVQKILSLAKDSLFLEERSIEEAKVGNSPMFIPSPRPYNRDQFFADLDRLDYDSLTKKYLTPPVKKRVVQFLKENFSTDWLSALRKVKQALRF